MSANITVAWTGASGLIYGVRLVEELLRAGRTVDLLASPAAGQVAPIEMGRPLDDLCDDLARIAPERLLRHDDQDCTAGLASGSAPRDGMVVCPCSMGTVARIAAGTSETLLLRTADVCLKERRPLILVPRETPLATHHLENLARLSARGVLVLPAAPGFYHRPQTVAQLVDFVVQRVCDRLQVPVELIPRWGER